jgi:sorting nexin-3/12
MSACQVAWPLYVSGIVEGVDVAQRLWVSRQLDFINSEMRIGKAAVLAELVRRAAAFEVQDMTCSLI